MSTTSTFINNLRKGDKVKVIYMAGEETRSIEGSVDRHFDRGPISVEDTVYRFVLRHFDYSINEDILAIGFVKETT